jgi:hypothetical protein
METFKYISNTNNRYLIYQDGKVYDEMKQRFMCISYASKNRKYATVAIVTNEKRTHKYIHRLLAETFIPNPENKPQVNHKDGNPLNNQLDNLEWVTCKENLHHAWDNGMCKAWNTGLGASELAFDMIKNLRSEGKTQRQIAKIVGIDQSAVSRILNNKKQIKNRRTA